jgi:hypothetical protein
MIYELLVRAQVAEALREAEKARLIKMAEKPRTDRTKPLLDLFLCRVGLISAC